MERMRKRWRLPIGERPEDGFNDQEAVPIGASMTRRTRRRSPGGRRRRRGSRTTRGTAHGSAVARGGGDGPLPSARGGTGPSDHAATAPRGTSSKTTTLSGERCRKPARRRDAIARDFGTGRRLSHRPSRRRLARWVGGLRGWGREEEEEAEQLIR
ncbi:hypothetical protein DAI22_01g378400 [Oryza sativa Japonica Group]|nr:hypothetical protein DAI22_01g378400 [Oryza sativa Japonica Group]